MSTIFADFIDTTLAHIERGDDESQLLDHVKRTMAPLLEHKDWLPASHRIPRSDRYAQYPLFVDKKGRFSVVSFVWAPGQLTPVHDHTVWGVVGVHQGVERNEVIELREGKPVVVRTIDAKPGDVGAVSPSRGDVHRVSNVSDAVAISIHAYGGDIGRIKRHVFDVDSGAITEFISGYDADQAIYSV